ncbi:MAG TPA: CBS domain-containing protein [Pseudomonadales bacterium]
MLHNPRHPERNTLLVTAEAKADYTKLLLNDFHALEALVRTDAFEAGVQRIGYELELNFVDSQFAPACIGADVVQALDDPRFTPEFARFNLELNSQPVLLNGRCFAQLHSGINGALAQVREEAAKHGCCVLMTGIVPTLAKSHITPAALTPQPRYEALYQIRRALKGDDYEYRIEGIDELLTRDNVALFAGSVTSFQVHLQVDVAELVDAYNWSQLLAGPVLACAVNSPLFLGKRLWQETRIDLFEQATDTRQADLGVARNRPRVFFGDGWVRESILELMQEDILGFDPLLCPAQIEDARHAIESGQVPRLDAWTLFNGTIYRWNRVCYGFSSGEGGKGNGERGKPLKPSLRIEARMLPAGPTVPDMVANAAFWSGAMAALPARYRNVQQRFDFALAKENFFKAARYGLDVEFAWFDRHVSARELILDELLPLARSGLKAAGVDDDDSERYLDIVRARTASGRTGAQWLLGSFNALRRRLTTEQALHALTAGMLVRQDSGVPVHQWEPLEAADALAVEAPDMPMVPVQRIMTSELHTVKADDALELVTHLMQWKHVGHVPVEDAAGRLIGMITREDLLDSFLMQAPESGATARAADVMRPCDHCVAPDTPLDDLLALMARHSLACVPVVDNGCIAGLVTEHELVRIAQHLLARQDLAAAHSVPPSPAGHAERRPAS